VIYTESKNEQGTPEWFAERRGIPTASEFKRFITATGKYSESQGKDSYIAELIAAKLGWQPDFEGNDHTMRGHYYEDEARRWLQLRTGVKVRTAGFCLHESGRYGASPDGFTAQGNPVEIKCPALHTFIKWRMSGGVPNDHIQQCRAHMAVTGADKCVFVAYADSEHIDNFYEVVERDEKVDQLIEAVNKFCDELEGWQRKLTGDEYEAIFT
jgi:putative phage-type endonuclease